MNFKKEAKLMMYLSLIAPIALILVSFFPYFVRLVRSLF